MGVRPGDIVLSYGGTRHPASGTLQQINQRLADQPIELIVLRGDKQETYQIQPKGGNGSPVIGVTLIPDLEHAVAAEVRKGSPAAEAGIPAGAELTAVGGTDVDSWYDVYHVLSASAGQAVTIAYEHAGRTGAAEVELTEDVFRPQDYAWRVLVNTPPLKPLTVKIQQDGVPDSLAWGGKVTVKMVLSTYLSIRSLIRGWLPVEEARGPLGLGHVAVAVARRSFMDLVYLLGFFSAAIAVFNFLPIPVVDGGHAVLLVVEKIRGKPLSVRVMNVVQLVGIVLILGVMVWVTWQDILRLIRS
jgi:regulator of sigma E protease